MRLRAEVVVLLPSILAVVACSDPQPRAPSHTVRDSAGVRIVENANSDNSRLAWPAAGNAVVNIGKQSGEKWEALHRVAYAAVLPTGDIAVVNGSPAEVFLYDSSGVYRRSIGTEGIGPGEFRFPTWVGIQHDSLVVLDEMYPSRVSVFSPTGEFVRRAPLSSENHLGEAGVHGVFADGALLLTGNRKSCSAAVAPPNVQWTCASLHRSDHRSGATTAIPGEFLVTRGDNRQWALRTASDFTANGNNLTMSLTHTYELRQYDISGRLLWISRVQRPRTPVAQGMIAEFNRRRDSSLARYSPEVRADFERRAGGPMTFPDSLSSYSRILAAGDAGVWAQRYEYPEGAASVWDVFAGDGVYRGSVTLPPRFSLYQVGADFVVGSWRDSLDVEYVRLIRLKSAANGT